MRRQAPSPPLQLPIWLAPDPAVQCSSHCPACEIGRGREHGGGFIISHQQQSRPATVTRSRGRAGGASPRPGRISEIFWGEGGALTCCCRATCSRSLEACFRMASIGRRPLRHRGRSRGGRRRAVTPSAGKRRPARGEGRSGGRRGESSCCCRLLSSIFVCPIASTGVALYLHLYVPRGDAGRKGGPAPGGRRGERGRRRRPARQARDDTRRNIEKMSLYCGLFLLNFEGFFEK